jgi:hypothetical protein
LSDEAIGDRVEVSAEAIITMQKMSKRVERWGGGACVIA